LFKNLSREVETRRGSGDGARLPSENGLVAGAIFDSVVAVDVGREGHVANAIQDLVKVCNWNEFEGAPAEFAAFYNLGLELDFACCVGEDEDFSVGNFAARADEGVPAVCCL
jgi:hypothetical protein